MNANDRGAIMALTAAAMIVFVGLAALAIDLGIGWSARRNLVTTTDAAALAAGGTYATGGTGCNAVAADYISSNNPDATLTGCVVSGSAASGTVIVDAEEVVGTFFGRAIGLDQFVAGSSSTVQWGAASSATGLRPFGLCAESDVLKAFLKNPNTITGSHKIAYEKDQPNLCGGNNVPGNWGMIDFDGGANNNNDTKDWIAKGYPGEVFSGTVGGTCTAEPYACYEGDTGAASNSYSSSLNPLVNVTPITLPIYDYVEGNGANAEFHIIGFARVIVTDFKFTGAEKNRYITLRFEPGIITGGCCSPGGTQTNVKTMAICDVDRKNLGSC